jgi:N-methylhydantoinase B
MGKRMYWLTFRLTTILTTLDPMMPHNAGMYRSISVVNPRGSVLNAEYPDAVCVRNSVPYRLFDCVTGAVMQATPDLLPAPSGGSMVTVSLAEIAADGFSRIVEVIQPLRCGTGGLNGRDGTDVRDNNLNNMKNQPIELVEAQSSLRIVEYDIRPDSGGPGKWRGGVGQALTVEILCDGAVFLARGMDRMRFPSWGVSGGMPGAPMRAILNRGRPDETFLGKIHELHVRRSDTVTLLMPGGAGFGDPLQRDVEAVLSDVERGFVSVAAASRDYGVAIVDGRVDAEQTAMLRAERSNAQPPTAFSFNPERAAWETVFTDDRMSRLNRYLYQLPKAVRHDARTRLFETAVPGISSPTRASLTDLMPDPSAAASRLDAALDQLACPRA